MNLEGPMFTTVASMKNLKHSIPKVEASNEAILYPVLSGEKILSNPRWRQYLQQIEALVNLPSEYYQETYTALILRFAEFVQVLPSVEGGRLGSLFDEGLRRALLALQIQEESSLSSEDPVYIYAVFSSALLLDLRKVLANKKVMISDEKGVFIDEWEPFAASLVDLAKHYKVRHYHRPITQLSPYITLLLARQVMPEAGFLWLAENFKWLNQWLAALSGDEEGGGSLSHILIIAKKRLREAKAKERTNLAPMVPVEFKIPEETAVGEAFWVWLKKGINDGSVSVNEADSSVHVIEYDQREAIFLEVAKIFQDYCVYAKYSDWRTVYNQFSLLGLVEFSGQYPDTQATLQKFIFLDKEKILSEDASQQLQAKDLKSATAGKFFSKLIAQRQEAAIKEQGKMETGYKEGVMIDGRRWVFADSKRQQISQYLKSLEGKKKLRVFRTLAKAIARKGLAKKISDVVFRSGPSRAA